MVGETEVQSLEQSRKDLPELCKQSSITLFIYKTDSWQESTETAFLVN